MVTVLYKLVTCRDEKAARCVCRLTAGVPGSSAREYTPHAGVSLSADGLSLIARNELLFDHGDHKDASIERPCGLGGRLGAIAFRGTK